METAEVQQTTADDANKAIAWAAIKRLHACLPTQDGLAILRGGEAKAVWVVAMVALNPGAMALAPLVQGASRTTQP